MSDRGKQQIKYTYKKINQKINKEIEAEDWNMLDEDEAEGSKWLKCILKITAILIITAFIAFSYAWLPSILASNLDFLKQDKALSEDDLVRRCKPAVVNIQTTKIGAAATHTQGTGVNLKPQGMIITNRHVVEGASVVEVSFSNGSRLSSQDIEFIDGYDLAVIQLQGQNLPFLPMITDQIAEIGQSVTIIGNPQGFQRVSCRGEVKEYYKTSTGRLVFTIAVPVAPGSSGSPVLDEKGRLIGIVYAAGKVAVDGEEQDRAIAIPAAALSHLFAEL